MNNYVRSRKCSSCGLVHAYSTNGMCPNCGSLNQPAKPKKGKAPVFIIAGATIAIWVCVAFVFAAQRNKIDDQPFVEAQQVLPEQRPGKAPIGLVVISISNGGPGMRAGLQQRDIIIQYGDMEVIDDASFYRAREKYEMKHASGVEMTVLRNGAKVNLTVPTGLLGFLSEEINPAIAQLNVLIKMIVNSKKLTPEQYERGVKEGHVKGSPQMMEKEAEQLIDKAEQEGTLTNEQILTARIYLIPDDATPQNEKKRRELIKRLLAGQPTSFALMLGNDRFFADEKYHAAIACILEGFKSDPSNVSVWLNLGVSYNKVSMFKEADAAANYVLANEIPLSEFGYGVLFQNKALAALGLGDYRNSMIYAEKVLSFTPMLT